MKDNKKNANLFLENRIREHLLAGLALNESMVGLSDSDKKGMADEVVRQRLSAGERRVIDTAENDSQKINCRIRGYEKNLISDFVANFKKKGGLVYGKKPTISNLTLKLWMLVCGRDLGLVDPIARSDLSLSLLTMRNLGSNLNALMRAYNKGQILEKFDDGEVLIADLHASVIDLKNELEKVVRLANGNHYNAVSGLMMANKARGGEGD